MRLAIGVLLVMLGLGVRPATGQEAKGTAAQVRFWSGRVVEISEDSVTVRRTLPGREPQDRKFQRTPSTKVDGEMEIDSRVTVGYVEEAQASIAKRILVRRARK
jgi:hypothetical protein